MRSRRAISSSAPASSSRSVPPLSCGRATLILRPCHPHPASVPSLSGVHATFITRHGTSI
eukprot:812606-Rhodomonas_salina.3